MSSFLDLLKRYGAYYILNTHQEVVVLMACQMFQHLIDERQGKVAFTNGSIQFLIIDANRDFGW